MDSGNGVGVEPRLDVLGTEPHMAADFHERDTSLGDESAQHAHRDSVHRRDAVHIEHRTR